MKTFYRLEDGRIWDTALCRFVDGAQARGEIIELANAGGEADLDCLLRALRFYGYGCGAYGALAEDGLKELLAELDAEYLTPRTLAGLATGDAEALARWQRHEELAGPYRARLAHLAQGENEEGEVE